MNHYLWWVPLVICWYAVANYLSVKNNADDTIWYQSKWFWMLLIMGFCPIWAIVSRVSNKLTADGMLYDTIIIISFPVCMILFGMTKHFAFINYIGLILVVMGLILLKVGQ